MTRKKNKKKKQEHTRSDRADAHPDTLPTRTATRHPPARPACLPPRLRVLSIPPPASLPLPSSSVSTPYPHATTAPSSLAIRAASAASGK